MDEQNRPVSNRVVKPALPADAAALQQVYKLKTARNLNDRVEVYFRKLFTNEQFRAYIDEIYDDEAKTGNLSYDDLRAADMIMAAAKAEGDNLITAHKEAPIVRSLRVVMKRFGLGRKERRSDDGSEG